MCEIAILLHDVVADDPVNDSKMFKRGDVIEVLADNTPWGNIALSNPNFRMFRLQGITVSAAGILTASEQPTDSEHVSAMLRPRMYSLDLTHPVLADSQALLNDDRRRIPIGTLDQASAEQWIADRIIKRPITDPDVIGQNTSRIG